jgi:hypothetical protein
VSQENAFQNALFKHANEKAAQMQKHLDNVIREGIPHCIYLRSLADQDSAANGQISLLQEKVNSESSRKMHICVV